MAESGPLWLPMLTIMAFIIVMGAALLAIIWLVSTRTTNRFLRTAAPVAGEMPSLSGHHNIQEG